MTINPSRSKDITVLNDDQHPKGKSLDNHPITKPQLEPERMSHLDEELHPNLPIVAGPHSGDIELVKLILEDNQRLRETNINLTKRFHQARPITRTTSPSPATLQEGETKLKLIHLY